jgi:hypothetical protein
MPVVTKSAAEVYKPVEWTWVCCPTRGVTLLVGTRRLAWKRQGLCRTGRPMWHTAYMLMQIGALAQRRCQRLDPGSRAQAVVVVLTVPLGCPARSLIRCEAAEDTSGSARKRGCRQGLPCAAVCKRGTRAGLDRYREYLHCAERATGTVHSMAHGLSQRWSF